MPVPLSLMFHSIPFCHCLCGSILLQVSARVCGGRPQLWKQTTNCINRALNFSQIRVCVCIRTHDRHTMHLTIFNVCGVVTTALPLPISSKVLTRYCSTLLIFAHRAVFVQNVCIVFSLYLYLSVHVCAWMLYSYIILCLHLFFFQTTSFVYACMWT